MPNKKNPNLSGGLFDAEKKAEIPGPSWSRLSNFDICNSTIETRDGYIKKESTAVNSGCLKFGFADNNRPHYVETTGGDYGFTVGTDTRWDCFVYCKEIASIITDARTIVSFTNDNHDVVNRLYFDGDILKFQYREDTGESFHTISATTANTRTGRSNYLVGVDLQIDSTTITANLYLGNTKVKTESVAIPAGYQSGGASTWTGYTNILLGTDGIVETSKNTAFNRGMYAYMGELCITKNETPQLDIKTSYNVIPPGHYCKTANRIAYYPLKGDYDDDWGNNPSFGQDGVYEAGGAGMPYYIRDNVINSASTYDRVYSLLNYTNTMHINTYGKDYHWCWESQRPLSSPYIEYLTSTTNNDYTITFDINVTRTGSSTTDFKYIYFDGYGPEIRVGHKDSKNALITYTHTGDGSSVSTTIPIRKNKWKRISCEWTGSTTAGGTSYARLYDSFSELSSAQGSITTKRTLGALKFGELDVSSVSVELYTGAVILHNDSVADDWGDVPDVNYSIVNEIKGYEVKSVLVSDDRARWGQRLVGKKIPIMGRGVEGGAEEYTPRFDRIYNYHDNVKAMWFLAEKTGYDYASSTDLASASITDGTRAISEVNGRAINYVKGVYDPKADLHAYGFHQPVWTGDRSSVGLVTSEFLADDHDRDITHTVSYLPTNPNKDDKMLLIRNNVILDNDGKSYMVDSSYGYGDKLDSSLRGFTYGNFSYLHNDEIMKRFDGDSVIPIDAPQPVIPLALTKTGPSGLLGAYIYAYSFTYKNGAESQLSIPTSVTAGGCEIWVHINLKTYEQSYIQDVVDSVNIYRNKGSTSSITDLTSNAGTQLFKLKSIDMGELKGVTHLAATDTTADFYLQVPPPAISQGYTVPPCKYSTLHNDRAYYTGDTDSPHTIYKSQFENPCYLDQSTPYREFRTEDGNENTAIGSVANGIIVFKENKRKYITDDGRSKEYADGGCIAHDSLQTVDGGLFGLGTNGFFWTNGPSYKNRTTSIIKGRVYSDIQRDVDSWSKSTKQNAYAVYHAGTNRYICYVNDKYYVFHTKRSVWRTYEDFIGLPIIYKNDFYIFKYGWIWKEVSSQHNIGDDVYEYDIISGTTGQIIISSTTRPATAKGLPIYIDDSYGWVTSITASGSNYKIDTTLNESFADSSVCKIGTMRAQADHFFDMETPDKRTIFKRIIGEVKDTSGGKMTIRLARDNGDFTDSYDDYVVETSLGTFQYVPKVTAQDMGIRFDFNDGKGHSLRTYTVEYEQGVY